MNTNDTNGDTHRRAGNPKANLLTLDFSRPVPVIYQEPELETCSDCRDEVPATVGGLCSSCRVRQVREWESEAERAYRADGQAAMYDGSDPDVDANDGDGEEAL